MDKGQNIFKDKNVHLTFIQLQRERPRYGKKTYGLAITHILRLEKCDLSTGIWWRQECRKDEHRHKNKLTKKPVIQHEMQKWENNLGVKRSVL